MNSSNSSKKRELDTTTITTFPCKLCPKIVSELLIILIASIYKIATNHGIAFLVPQCSFHLVNLNNKIFLSFVNNNNDNNESKILNSSLILKPPPDLALLFNHFNNAIPENSSDPKKCDTKQILRY